MSGKPEVALKSGLPQSRQKALLTVFPLSATSKWTLGSRVMETSTLGKPNWPACPVPVICWHCLQQQIIEIWGLTFAPYRSEPHKQPPVTVMRYLLCDIHELGFMPDLASLLRTAERPT